MGRSTTMSGEAYLRGPMTWVVGSRSTNGHSAVTPAKQVVALTATDHVVARAAEHRVVPAA